VVLALVHRKFKLLYVSSVFPHPSIVSLFPEESSLQLYPHEVHLQFTSNPPVVEERASLLGYLVVNSQSAVRDE
jgi:methionine-rich copper-binding protein CopC